MSVRSALEKLVTYLIECVLTICDLDLFVMLVSGLWWVGVKGLQFLVLRRKMCMQRVAS